MDYVYICRNGKNEELRYSIRSLEKNMPNGNIFVIGYRPDWYIGNFIKVEDISSKFDNIKNCISVIKDTPKISDDFILMNDDFFALKPIEKIKIFHGGGLEDKINRYKENRMSPKYIRLLELTNKQLKRNGIDNPIDYDIHVPMPMNKEKLKSSIDIAYFPRSAYGNVNSIGGEKIIDVKIYKNAVKKNIEDYSFISTEDQSFFDLKNKVLRDMFSKHSSIENPKY
jgi:stress response protein SCP2